MINIIGAGPAGNYLAYLLTKTGKEVQVFEEHKEIGKPVQCTGIVTSEFEDVLEPRKEFTVNKTNKVKIKSVSGKCIDLRLKRNNYILDRAKFDLYLAKQAEKEGADFFLGSQFINENHNSIFIKQNDKIKKINKGILIGADGPLSSVARSHGIYIKRRMIVGFQYRVNMKNDNFIEFYPGIGIYAWIVPEGKGICRVGMCDYVGQNIRKTFDIFTKKIGIAKKSIIDCQAGLIPTYNPFIKIQKKDVFLIGDAAAQVKATTGGGIVPGLIAAKGLAKSILDGSSYKQNIWRLRKELFFHMIGREILDNLKKRDWDYLFKLFENKKNKEILSSIERERISRLALPLFRNDPRFLFFVKKIFF